MTAGKGVVRVGQPARATARELSVRVVDENDARPTFAHTAFTVRALENGPPGLPLGSVCASDADEGPAARLRYCTALHCTAPHRIARTLERSCTRTPLVWFGCERTLYCTTD